MARLDRRLRRPARFRAQWVLALCLMLSLPVIVQAGASPLPAPQIAARAEAVSRAQDNDAFDEDHGRVERNGDGGGGITITSIDGNRIALATDDGWTRTITITPATTITKADKAATVSSLRVGDRIRFRQQRNADGTYTILAIRVPTARTGGAVTGGTSSSLTITGRNGTPQTVGLTATTTYQVGQKAATRADIKVGSKVRISGTIDGTTFTALNVRVELSSSGGTVTSKTSSTIMISQRDGATTVIHVGPGTTYEVRGDTTPALADIAVGDRVTARGTTRTDGSLDAHVVREKSGKGR